MKELRLVGWALLALALAAGLAAAGEWPRFRGPGGSGVSNETGLPVKWGPKENVRWKADLPGRGVSSPVIAGGRVYVTACSGYRQRRLHVLCFDAVSGKKLWERQVAATGSTMCHPKTCMAAPTPVTDGKHVFALFATNDLAAFDASGNLLWYRALSRDYPDVSNQVGMAASPVLAGDTLLLPLENVGDSFAAGLDPRTGKNRWRVNRPRDINWVTPLVVRVGGRPQAIFQTSADVTAYEPETGRVRWTLKGQNTGPIAAPVAGQGLVFALGNQMLALRPRSDGTAPEVVWRSNKLRAAYATPLYHKGRLYGMTAVGVTCLDAATGEAVWQQRVKGTFSASPILGDGKLYVANEEGTVTVFQVGDRPKVLAQNKLGETLLATPALADGCLFLRSDKHLFCIGARK